MSGDSDNYAEKRVGLTLKGKYRLERMLGAGGMAAVYQAEHRNGNRVAIKLLHPEIAAQSELRSRFLREGYVANKVAHPGAVRVLDDDIAEDGSVFLVMELLEGETLDQLAGRHGGRLTVRELCELSFKLLEVLAAAHSKGVVHRDIKPDNVFLTSDGLVKVLDFGIARLNDSAGGTSATRTGNMMGTPAFMAPEQALGRSRQIDAQSDLFSVGATMFTLASGRYVHEGETAEEIVVYTASRPARSVLAVVPNLPHSIAGVIDCALRYEKAERWPDAGSMGAALADAYRSVFGSTLTGVRPSLVSAVAALPPTQYGLNPSQYRAHASGYETGPLQGFTGEQAPWNERSDSINPATAYGAPSAYGSAGAVGAQHPGTASGAHPAPNYTGRGLAPPGATTTASVVSNQVPIVPRYVGAPSRRKRGSKLTLPLFVVGTVSLLVALTVALRGSSDEAVSASPAGGAVVSALPSAPPATSFAAAPLPAAASVAAVATPRPPPVASVDRPATASLPAARRPVQQRPARQERDDTPVAPLPPPPRVPVVDCSVPTYFDGNGIKRFKPGCN